MAIMSLTEEEWLETGLIYAGFDIFRQNSISRDNNLGRFRSFYGINPTPLILMHNDLQTNEDGTEIDGKKNGSPKHLLMTLHWLKTYTTEPILAGLFELNERTVRKFIWQYASALQSLKSRKVRLFLIIFKDNKVSIKCTKYFACKSICALISDSKFFLMHIFLVRLFGGGAKIMLRKITLTE